MIVEKRIVEAGFHGLKVKGDVIGIVRPVGNAPSGDRNLHAAENGVNQLTLARFFKSLDERGHAGKIVFAPKKRRNADTPGLAPKVFDLGPGPVRVFMHDNGFFPVVLH